jgi:hypothetical protein
MSPQNTAKIHKAMRFGRFRSALLVIRRGFVRIFVLPIALVLLAAILLMNWRLSSEVEIKLTLDRLDFSVAGYGNEVVPVLNQVDAQSVGVTKFGAVTLTPKTLEVADPALYDKKTDSYPRDAWKILPVSSRQIAFPGEDEILNPTITLETALGEPLNIDHLSVRSGTLISYELAPSRLRPLSEDHAERQQGDAAQSNLELRITIHSQEPSEIISSRGGVTLIADHSVPEGVGLDPKQKNNELVFRTTLADSEPTIRLKGRSGVIALLIRFTPMQSRNLFYEGALAVSQLKFIKEDSQTQSVRASLVGGVDNSITFVDTAKERVVFRSPDFLELDDKDVFHIKDISLNPKANGIDLRLVGTATEIRTGMPGKSIDHRVTAFDKIWHNKYVVALFVIACWLPTAIFSIRKAIQE